MAHLTLAGVSDDGKRLLLVNEEGVEFTLDIDTRLRSALRGDHGRTGKLEIEMDSTLRPRDIQARIRAGETPDAVAEAAHTTVDKIMAFAAPVLAERQHVADRAQRSSVRRKNADSAGGARTLGDVVAHHLRSINVDPASVEWDAWRREDGRWALTGEYATSKRKGSGHFTFDAPGNYVTAENEDARWLLGEVPSVAAPTPRDDLRQARQRRLTSVPEDELPLGDDAIDLVSDTPLEAFLTEEPPADDLPQEVVEEQAELAEEAADAAALDEHEPEPEPAQPADEEPPSRRPVKKSRGRASVPSWDEIMFGGGKND
ncbi:septation protein SepH [Nocardioides ginsengisegetis]|uniref:septation protein SepH n=1 Tax=Nocardioides ginsengisegetis TaxID=661491 RepID=UPI001FE38E8A|nr:septation protein SepH [Nocardioides ginsengisegetis]